MALAALLLPALFGGCLPIPYPHRVVTNARVEGRLVDAESGRPVGGAIVSLRSVPEARDRSDPAGRFLIERRRETRLWFLLPLAPVPLDPRTDRLTISAAGYRQLELELLTVRQTRWIGWEERSRLNLDRSEKLGELPLLRLPLESAQYD